MPIGRAGDVVARRSLDFYDAVARRLAAEGRSHDGNGRWPARAGADPAHLVALRMPRALEVLDHAVPARTRRSQRPRADRHAARRGAERARDQPYQDGARMGRPGDDQDPRRVRLLIPALARSRAHSRPRRTAVRRRARGRPLPRAPGTGKSHLAVALGVEAVKAGRSVYFTTLADIVGALAKAEREGQLRERIRLFCRQVAANKWRTATGRARI